MALKLSNAFTDSSYCDWKDIPLGYCFSTKECSNLVWVRVLNGALRLTEFNGNTLLHPFSYTYDKLNKMVHLNMCKVRDEISMTYTSGK